MTMVVSSIAREDEPPTLTSRRLELAPDLPRGLDHQAEFRGLLFDRQGVAVDGRGEAALRRQAELLERNVFGGLVDAALELVLGFERRAFRGDEAEHHARAAFWHKTQR